MEPEYNSCMICPKRCGVNRNKGEKGFCGETADIKIAWAGLHFGEEPPLTGKGGSGTIFITGCNLGCLFCQNYQISQDGVGRSVSTEEFVEICLSLEHRGAENINIVTGSHSIPAIATGLSEARQQGLLIPILWNSSAYECPEALERLKDLVTVWLPDLKTLNPAIAEKVFRAADYPATAKKSIRWMVTQNPKPQFSNGTADTPQGTMTSGVIVRHLVLPGRLSDTKLVLQWYSEHFKDKALLSLMTQYTPVCASTHAQGIDAFPDRLLEHSEETELHALLEDYDIESGFVQELVQSTDWLPDFTKIQPFSSELAKPVWHWKTGFLPI